MINNKQINQLEIILMASGIVTLVITASVVIYSFGFLSKNLLRALSSDAGSNNRTILFDVDGFNKLGL